jgi:hypothetical protein
MPKAISARIYLLIVVIVGCASLSALSAWYVYNWYTYNYNREIVPAPTSIDDIIRKNPPIETQPTIPEEPTLPSEEIPEKKPIFPQELNLDAPFYSQAPFSNWDFPWQEACEEASILLAANVYWKHNWTRDEFNTQILNMVDWQEEKFGTYLDTTVAQTAQIVNEYLKLETLTHENPTYDDVVEILNK